MTITVRAGFLRPLVVSVLLLCCAPQLFGADGTYVQNAKGDQPRETVLQLDSNARLGVIVEFREAPLLVSRGTMDVRLASASLDALASQLAKDLARIEGEVPGRIAAQAEEGGAIRHTYRMAFAGASATVSRKSLPALRALPYVRAVHEDKKVEMFLARSVPHIGVPQVRQQYGLRGKGVVVAIIDTGVDYTHWALGEGFGPGFKVIGGWDFVNNDADPMDDNGHGTHVAGIVAANHQYLTGVAPEATLLAYKVLGQDGSGQASIVLAAVERAIDPNDDGDPSDHADVVNMSLGGPAVPDDPVIAAVERGAAAGVLFSLAAGNTGRLAGLGTPAMAPSAITVAASTLEDKVAGFSTGGPVGGTWGLKPEISAPGVKINSSVLDDKQRAASGTSMAAPHVSGVAALLLEQHPGWTPGQVKAAIVSSAKPIGGRDNDGSVTAGSHMAFAGSGRIDALAAIEATILPSQPAATFGMVTAKAGPWTSSTTVTFTNHGTSSETLTVQQPPVPGGAKLTVTPETLTLAPGASAELKLTLEVAADAKPNESDVLIAGFLTLAGTKTSVRLPWTALKADVLQVTYAGDEDFVIFLSNGGDPAGTWPAGPRTYGALIPFHLTSDILILTPQTETCEARFLLRERYPVDGFTEVTLTPEDAPYLVHFDAQDERGIPLTEVSAGNRGRLWHQFELPSMNYIRIIRDDGVRKMRISKFRETRVISYETAANGTDRWFAAYPHLRNTTTDLTFSIRTPDWASQKIRHRCATDDCTASAGVGTGSPIGYMFYPLPRNAREWTLHLTGPVEDRYDFRGYFFVREGNFAYDDNLNPWTFMSNSLRNVNGRFSTSPFGRLSGAEYFPPDRETPLVLGDGPSIMRTAVGPWFVIVEPYGSAGEYYGDRNVRDVDVKVERLDGPLAQMEPFNHTMYAMRPVPGLYRVTVTDGYEVAGRPGRLTQVSNYDSRQKPEGVPTLSSLRVENGRGVATWTVQAGSPSRVAFAVRHSRMTGQGSWDAWHSREFDTGATQAWWRPHGTAVWLPLNVSRTGEDYEHKGDFPGPPGTLYTASLAQATAVEGAVDLKFAVANFVGATTEVVYEPAFVVGPAGAPRRRPMR